ncbi:MAG: hypothetical protein B9S30_08310, partial [Verrucomicrobiia bacterium Tous-C5FEB]
MTPIGKPLPCPSISAQRKRNFLRSFDGLLAAVTLAGLAFAAPAVHAASYTWTPLTAGPFNWNNANSQNNWTSGFPNALADVANMSVNLSANQTVNLNQAITLGTLTIGDNNGVQTFTLAPSSGSLIFDVSSGTASLNRSSAGTGATTVSSNITLNDNLVVKLAGGTASSTMTLSGIISESGGAKSLTKDSGTLTLALTGSNTFSGGVIIKNGTLESRTTTTTLGSGTATMGGAGSTGATYLTGQSNSNRFVINAPDSGNIVIGANGAGSGFTMSGGVTLNGNLTLQTNENVITGSTKAISILTGGVTGTGNLLLNNLGLAANVITISGTSVNHSGSITLQGTATGTTTISAPIGSNVTSVTQNSATSRLVLSGSNAYTGATNINAGTLALGASNVLPDASAVSIGAATLDAATFADSAGTLDVTAANSAINLGSGATLAFANSSAVDWTGGTLNITGTFVSGTSLRFGTTSGGLTSTQLSSITADGISSFALNANGYLIDAPPPELVANDAVVGFPSAVSGSTTFVLAGSATSTITLTFSINNVGLISLNASTNATNSTFASTVNAWDNSNVGSVADAALLGKTFTLTGTASGGGNLTLSSNGGGGIGIQGENSNRVDGLNYGTSSTPETLTWTLSAPPGLSLGFKNWSHNDGSSGDIRVSNGTINSDFSPLASTTGTSALSNFQLNNGESLTFKEIPDMGATDGAGISGFSFEVIPVAITEYAFDNGGGDNLWTNSTNWFPNGLPASVSDAIINGYDVILNSAATSSPDELRIINGSLTLNGSGAL